VLGVPDTRLDKNQQVVSLDLNGRVQLFEKSNPTLGRTFTALRMVGNLGSHGEDVKREALLDALELYEDALDTLFSQKQARIEQLRKKLIDAKGRY
jgi:hypothetical protein